MMCPIVLLICFEIVQENFWERDAGAHMVNAPKIKVPGELLTLAHG
jgi:hypothetical protein